jgi:hypothetical protein
MLIWCCTTPGRPTVVVPFFGDQPFWGAMVARAGAGPDPIPHKQLTADKLVKAIDFCLRPESLERAKELARKIAEERGSDVGAQSFHQYLEVDRLRCTLSPARAATWRIKRTQVRLSAFAACTLANADLLDFHDLKLFRAQEYATDEGPWDPISGAFTTACRAFGNMGMGLAELPSETLKGLQIPFGSRRQDTQSSMTTTATADETSRMGARSTPPTLLARSQTTAVVQEPLAGAHSPPHLSGRSYSTSNIASSSISGNQSSGRDDSSSSKNHDMLRHNGAHASKGIGRITKALVQSPMELSVSITRGFHNVPKMWGDETVRPQRRVSDFKSGMKAMGNEFSYGWYDGVTGLFTQPYRGAQKEGATGLIKGIGKGVGGFIAKPGAAMVGVIAHSMKGVHKEVQKMYGSNVQNYIVASRVSQGYEEWLMSSDAEKEDVIVRWKLIQKYLKKKRNKDEMIQDVLDAQKEMSMQGGRTDSAAQSSSSVDVLPQGSATSMRGVGGSHPHMRSVSTAHEEQLGMTGVHDMGRSTDIETSRGNVEETTGVEPLAQETSSQLQRQQQEVADEEALRQAIAYSEAESQRHANESLEYEQELKRAMEQSLRDQTERSSESASDLNASHEDDKFANSEGQRAKSGKMVAHSANIAGSSLGAHQLPSYDHGHLGGTTQSEFEAQQQGEKSTQEKTEEEIVMEYVKKQSLLESHHRNKGKGRVAATEDAHDEDLQKALELSRQEKQHGASH